MNNNPLKQYFRRPSIYLKLPSGGKNYAPGVIDMPETGELPVYPMTAIDEITARTPDALFNGVAVAQLIASCIPDIKDPWQINSMDLDAILIAVRASSGNGEMKVESTCPACGEASPYSINLVAILSSLEPGDYSTPLEINELSFKFKPLTYKQLNDAAKEQFSVQRVFATLDFIEDAEQRATTGDEALRKITELTMDIVSSGIEYIQTPTVKVTEKEFINDFLHNCDKEMYISIRDFNSELKRATELKPLKMKCDSCEHEYEQSFTLNPADFFE